MKYTSKKFRVSSSIILQTENRNNVGRGQCMIFLWHLIFMVEDKNFNNEIFYLRSLPLIQDVVNQMDLRIYYYSQDELIPKQFTFGMQNIHKNSPIIVIPDEGNSQPVGIYFHIDILNENRFFISAKGEGVDLVDLKTNRIVGKTDEFNLSGIYDFGASVTTEHSSFRVLLNSSYQPERFSRQESVF
jgi:hypothetical protein